MRLCKLLEISAGWLVGDRVTHKVSQNCDLRPVDMDVNLLVVHNISLPPNQFGGDEVELFFCNELDFTQHTYFQNLVDVRVSSHLFIKRCGSIVQFVPFDKRAWHAGKSEFAGVDKCNDFSIGVELEGADDIPYTEEQYHILNQVISVLYKEYPKLVRERVVGHCDIAPGRKSDPGEVFEWRRLV